MSQGQYRARLNARKAPPVLPESFTPVGVPAPAPSPVIPEKVFAEEERRKAEEAGFTMLPPPPPGEPLTGPLGRIDPFAGPDRMAEGVDVAANQQFFDALQAAPPGPMAIQPIVDMTLAKPIDQFFNALGSDPATPAEASSAAPEVPEGGASSAAP